MWRLAAPPVIREACGHPLYIVDPERRWRCG
jgi:hypothetical protein